MQFKIPYTVFTLICPFFLFAQQHTNTDVKAQFTTQQIDDIVKVNAEVRNQTNVFKTLKFSFSTFKTDSLGQINKTIVEERFTLEENEKKQLAETTFNINDTLKTVFLLLVYEEEQIIAKDRFSFNEKKDDKLSDNQTAIAEDGIELKGIVIEETKTKPGKDFYDYFYNFYTIANINGSKIVGVYEQLSFGRSTIIQVKIEEQLIHEFLAKPDIEYLEEMAKTSVRMVYKYFKELKNQKETIFQY